MSARERSTAPTDAVLIEGFLRGDHEAARTIRDWVVRIVHLRAWRLRSDDDLTQDVLLDLVDSLGSDRFEGRSSLKTYVERIASYRCIDALRHERLRRHPSLEEIREPLPSSDDSPEERSIANDEARICFQVLSRLGEPCRELLRRLFAEDAAYEDLAREYGVAVGTIKSRVARCREQANQWRRRLTADSAARGKDGSP